MFKQNAFIFLGIFFSSFFFLFIFFVFLKEFLLKIYIFIVFIKVIYCAMAKRVHELKANNNNIHGHLGMDFFL